MACSLPAKSIKLNLLICTIPLAPGDNLGPLGVLDLNGVALPLEGDELRSSIRDSIVYVYRESQWRVGIECVMEGGKEKGTNDLENGMRTRTPLIEICSTCMTILFSST